MKSAVGLLVLTALGKCAMLLGGGGWLRSPDPVLGFLLRGETLMLAFALEMLAVSRALFWGAGNVRTLAAMAWLATVFGAYRLLGWALASSAPCDCLGNIGQALELDAKRTQIVAGALLGYLLVGSYAFLLRAWRMQQATRLSPIECRSSK